AQETEAPEEESSPEPTPGAEESAPQETQDPETAEDGEPAGAGVPLWLAIAGGVVLLLLAVPALLRLVKRRSRLSGDDAARTEGVWEEIAASTIDAGRPWDRSRTLRDQHERIAADLEPDDVRLLEQATEAAEALRYGDGIPEGTALNGPEAARLVQRVRQSQSREIGPWSRVRAVILPRSLTQRPQAPRT